MFAQPIIYVLECKWGLVRKKNVDDFLDVLRWSKEFGVDTPEGRQIRQGIVGVFAGSAFNPKERVRLKDETEISLATYAARINIQLLKASDFNEKLRDIGCLKRVTVQKICKIARDERKFVKFWKLYGKTPAKVRKSLQRLLRRTRKYMILKRCLKVNNLSRQTS